MHIRSIHDSRPTGTFRLKVFRLGQLIESYEDANQIVDGFRSIHALLIAGDFANNSVSQIGFGTSLTPALPGNTALTGAYVKAVDGAAVNGGTVTYSFSLGAGEANGLNIGEFGLLTAAGALYARKARTTTALPKSSALSLSGTWQISL